MFPTAQKRRSSAFRCAVLDRWIDIASLRNPSFRQEVQYEGLSESANAIIAMLNSELRILAPENVLLAGLYQGCAMSLAILLSLGHRLGGFIGISGWLPLQKDIIELVTEEDQDDDDPFSVNDDDDPFSVDDDDGEKAESPFSEVTSLFRDILSRECPQSSVEQCTVSSTAVFLGRGETEEKIPSRHGKCAAETLREIGMDVTWKSYPEQGYWYKSPEQIDDFWSFSRRDRTFSSVSTSVRPDATQDRHEI
jgi:predicted esterase